MADPTWRTTLKKIERSALPEPRVLRRLLCDEPDLLSPGARVVDSDAQGPTGVDVVMTDESGNPIFVDILNESPRDIPVRLIEHLKWLEGCRRLFLRAYSREGVVRAESPEFIFVAGDFPPAVVESVAAVADERVSLVRAECFSVDGHDHLSLSPVEMRPRARVSSSLARRAGDVAGGREKAGFERFLDTEGLGALFALFRSGIDGLDGRIAARDANGGMVFELGPTVLASVASAPGGFAVAPGDSDAPIVVSDRSSLERALNAVVSLFVREGASSSEGGNGSGARLVESERAELARIWGSGIEGPKES